MSWRRERLYCPNCPNQDEFVVNSREWHTWATDEYGDMTDDIECYDSETDGDFRCARCDTMALWVPIEDNDISDEED